MTSLILGDDERRSTSSVTSKQRTGKRDQRSFRRKRSATFSHKTNQSNGLLSLKYFEETEHREYFDFDIFSLVLLNRIDIAIFDTNYKIDN